MNIRTKLLITFGVVVAVPLFLISLVFFGFMSMQPAEVATPQIREFLGEMLVSVILIMAMTCSFLMAWIYRSILTPIETLKKATRNIRDGNLDFEVEIGDDDEIGELCADFEEMRIRLKESTEEKVVFAIIKMTDTSISPKNSRICGVATSRWLHAHKAKKHQ